MLTLFSVHAVYYRLLILPHSKYMWHIIGCPNFIWKISAQQRVAGWPTCDISRLLYIARVAKNGVLLWNQWHEWLSYVKRLLENSTHVLVFDWYVQLFGWFSWIEWQVKNTSLYFDKFSIIFFSNLALWILLKIRQK